MQDLAKGANDKYEALRANFAERIRNETPDPKPLDYDWFKENPDAVGTVAGVCLDSNGKAQQILDQSVQTLDAVGQELKSVRDRLQREAKLCATLSAIDG